jgi:hypothetical protein
MSKEQIRKMTEKTYKTLSMIFNISQIAIEFPESFEEKLELDFLEEPGWASYEVINDFSRGHPGWRVIESDFFTIIAGVTIRGTAVGVCVPCDMHKYKMLGEKEFARWAIERISKEIVQAAIEMTEKEEPCHSQE